MINMLALISIVLFYTVFLKRALMLHLKGVRVWVTGSGKRSFLEILLIPVIVLWPILIILAAPHTGPFPVLTRYIITLPALKYMGLIFCYGGLLIFVSGLASFGRTRRTGIDEKNSNGPMTGGIFKYSRNPVFLFMDLYYAGITLLYPNVLFICAAVAAIAGIHLQILREEQFLKAKFGEEYEAYKKTHKEIFLGKYTIERNNER